MAKVSDGWSSSCGSLLSEDHDLCADLLDMDMDKDESPEQLACPLFTSQRPFQVKCAFDRVPGTGILTNVNDLTD